MGLRPRFTTPLSQARDRLARYVIRPFDAFQPQTRLYIGFGGVVLITTLLLFSNISIGPTQQYEEGDVVSRSLISPADITTTDIPETEKRKNLARESTRPVFNYDSTRAETSAQSFRALWNQLKNQQTSAVDNSRDNSNAGLVSALKAHNFDESQLERITALIHSTGQGYIVDDSQLDRLRSEIVLVDVRNPAAHLIIPDPRSRMTSLSAARHSLEDRLGTLQGWSAEQKSALIKTALPLLRPNVVLDQTATTTAREAEAAKVLPVVISLKRNQVIAREGDTITPVMLSQLAAIRNSERGRPWQHLIGLLLVVLALYWAVWKFTEHRSATSSLSLSKRRAFALVSSAIVVQTFLLRVGFGLGDSVAAQMVRAPFNDATIWNFAIPFAAAALLVAMLVDTQLAFITGVVSSIYAGMLAPTGMQKVVYSLVACAAAVYGIGRYRERQSVTLAGLLVGAVNILVALALVAYSQQQFSFNLIWFAVACAITSGLLSAVFTAGGLPINESLFGILTDVKLLELSNADLPVLGQMAIRAPGTNQHSHAVGQLAEDASRAVGANPLLARIGALYHDIGKLAAPEYFVENQQGDNPHDRLRPSQSARIITSHVTYGLRLAKEIGLPKKIADFIPQHHGTRTLHFFLRKAQALAGPSETVDEKEFRYPGPKPQFKEAAIMMLADSCEAAARSLERPDPENIRTIVMKIVDAIISDGQLDECDITLRELTTIREAIISALTAIYHARIDYPGFNPPPVSGSIRALPADELDSEERGVSYSKASEVPISEGGEVEDEALPRRTAKR
jgi:putative nucleotidyltransferase with HDIG domain